MDEYTVRLIPNEQTYDWLLHKHYAHRIPSISFAFGLYSPENILTGICCYGSPPSPSLCIGICGEEYKDQVLELIDFASTVTGKTLPVILFPEPSNFCLGRESS